MDLDDSFFEDQNSREGKKRKEKETNYTAKVCTPEVRNHAFTCRKFYQYGIIVIYIHTTNYWFIAVVCEGQRCKRDGG